MATVKRTLAGYDDPVAAWGLINEQREAAIPDDWRKRKFEQLYDAGEVHIVPYLGTLEPGPRPGKAINVVGLPDLEDLAAIWYDMKPGEQILVVGPKGDGKSCRLRAFASLLCSAAPVETVVVCIWNMERARRELVKWFVDALKFAYAEHEEVVSIIDGSVTDIMSLKAFLEERKSMGNDFTFIVDGVQALDTLTSAEKTRPDAEVRHIAYGSLMDVIGIFKVVFGISPKAMQYKEYQRTADPLIKTFQTEGFSPEQVETFMHKASVLGAVVADNPYRQQQVEYYAANHPHSLDILDRVVVQVASNKLLRPRTRRLNVDRSGRWASSHKLPDLTPEMVAELLDSDDDWDLVISTFVEDKHFRALRTSIRDLNIVGDFSTDTQMIEVDPRYAYTDRFCTPFVQQVYVEEFRNKEQDIDEYGPWVAYAKVVVRSPALNWSEAGWLCERLCNDVISRRGLCIEPRGFYLNMLSATTFSSIPSCVATGRLSKGSGYMFMPIQYNYGRVDAVVFYRDTIGKLHIIGLQYTTNLEKHLHSESEFMSIRVLEKWYKNNILEATRKSLVELDYVFVCTTAMDSQLQEENVMQLRNGSHVGILKHKRHVISFQDGLEGRVNSNVRCVMRDMAAARERCFQDVPGALDLVLPPLRGSSIELSNDRFKKIKRYEANALAENAGIDPTDYSRLELLKQKLVDDKVIIVVSRK